MVAAKSASAGVMGRSSVPARPTGRRQAGAPVYTFERVPGVPPVAVVRFSPSTSEPVPHHAHAHDFLVLVYVERSGGSVALDERAWIVEAGDAVVIAPGEVVSAGPRGGFEGWTAFFPADILGPASPGSFLSWRTHPLLFPFVGRAGGGAHRLRVPATKRAGWSARFAALERELDERRDGYAEAALAHLSLLLVDLSRLAGDAVAGLRIRDEPLLAEVFAVVEARYAERLSLRDVARAVGLTPGHLTTVVRTRTGRTVQEWIAERRMAEARRLLAGTDLTVDAVGRRVGYGDAGYFIRVFRRRHRVTPLQWRRAGRA
jgi:AraC family transcriptional activator of pobA